MKVLIIDNFDLFTYNLADEFEKKECEVIVYRNDTDIKIIDSAVKKFKPNLIAIASGSGNAANAGACVEIIQAYQGKIPILGIGLGHECIIEAFGGSVGRSPVIVHGRTAKITHDGKTIFKKMGSPFIAGRYNSLSASDVPYALEVSARDENGIVMGVRHKSCFVEGLQFHPESILTIEGSALIDNVLREAGKK